MCVSTPSVPTVSQAPTQSVEMDSAQNVVAARQNDLRRRQRALSRATTMAGGSAQDAVNGKTRLGA